MSDPIVPTPPQPATPPADPPPTPDATHPTADPPGAEALGDAGKKALDAMKADVKALKDRLALTGEGSVDRADRITAEIEELRAFKAKAEGREVEYEATLAAQKVKDEALGVANERILNWAVRAAAAAKLADPADATLYLDLSGFKVGPDGEVDGDAITSAIDDLLKSKPYLAAQGTRFKGGADGGARNESAPAQVSREEMSRMTPEQIVQAEADGRLSDLLNRT